MVKNSHGIVLIETIISIAAFAYIVLAMLFLIQSIMSFRIERPLAEYELAILQVQWQMAINDDVFFENDKFCFNYYSEMRCLNIIDDRLILSPGTQIVWTGVVDLEWLLEDGWVSIQGKVHDKRLTLRIWNIE